jgi:16S rRNA (adenine1518-N6/adenine1519-N6)-dimethyltransferase
MGLGQHHLVDERIVSQIVECLGTNTNEVVLELGSGTGRMTRLISESSRLVHSYEVDAQLFDLASLYCQDRSNVQLYNRDLFGTTPPEFTLFVSNIPYRQSRQVLHWLACHRFVRGVIMVQDEFARKMLSQPWEANFCGVSIISQYCFTLESIAIVPPEAFVPLPKVTSRVIQLTSKNKLLNATTIKKIGQLRCSDIRI